MKSSEIRNELKNKIKLTDVDFEKIEKDSATFWHDFPAMVERLLPKDFDWSDPVSSAYEKVTVKTHNRTKIDIPVGQYLEGLTDIYDHDIENLIKKKNPDVFPIPLSKRIRDEIVEKTSSPSEESIKIIIFREITIFLNLLKYLESIAGEKLSQIREK